MQDEVAEQVAKSTATGTDRAGDLRPRGPVGDWLEDHGIDGAWDYAPTFVEAGLDTDWLERVSASVDEVDASASLQRRSGGSSTPSTASC